MTAASGDAMKETGALFLPDAGGFVGTICTQGAWDPGAQNGTAVLSLLGHLLEDVPTLVPMALSRLTVDLVRPVPVGRRFTVQPTVRREGKKIQLVDLVVTADDVEYVHASALRVRAEDITSTPGLPLSTTDADPAADLEPPVEREPLADEGGPGMLLAVDMRRADLRTGGFGYWVRLKVPVVAGEPLRPTALQAFGVDFTNCIGAIFDARIATTINPDVTGHFLRPPTGEWLGVVGDTRFAHDRGRGISYATLSDRDGVYGVASTSQIVQPQRR